MNGISIALKRALVRFTILILMYFAAALICLIAARMVRAQTLSAGYDRTCAIDASGGVQCWGGGALGNGSTADATVPIRPKYLTSGVIAVTVNSSARSCALRSSGEVLCWGANSLGELGDGTTTDRWVPTPILGLGPGSGVTAIALGEEHACALKSDGTVLCWGHNRYGQIGNGAVGGVLPPTVVNGFAAGSGVVAIAAGGANTCAIKSDQSVYCWGHNGVGEVGDGTTVDRYVPTPVTSLGFASGVISVSVGFAHACAVRNDGDVFCWGFNGVGQLGNGGIQNALVPTPTLLHVDEGALAVEVNGTYSHTCARSDKGVFCWGSNNSGELGDGTTTDRDYPVQVLTLGAGIPVDAVVTGIGHSCARRSIERIVCWGSNFAGQLGNDTNVDSLTPQTVMLDESIFADGFE